MGTTARLCFCLLGCLALSPWLEGAAPEVESCPRGWLFYRGNCYGLFLQPLPWAEAEAECRSYGPGTHLAWVRSAVESGMLAIHVSQRMPAGGVWIGLHRPPQGGGWTWTGDTGFSFSSWEPGEPGRSRPGAGKLCALMWSGTAFLKWKAEHCAAESAFLCQCRQPQCPA
ncbi:C-type lectin lectoxin-Thr1 isoform X2 [Alligator mississippiensis]|uniref:C-type lectin lectoxin-Thr1 isoform X2 n=1 Tax=Alligator mississippiensis TaxID=8496 RepID=UPI0009072B56|nr:C-type lectin lectoxin-Thr1 isoform X2 [Alligator mississippiensis]